MKYFKILPAAAGVIALTATVAFARDLRDTDEAYPLRIKVEASESAHSDDNDSAGPAFEAGDVKPKYLYLVEVARENAKNVITIDASTGRILSCRQDSA